jgi:hypothetical protein
MKLQIKESNEINERLEQISNSTYCTDYVGDITNWILNKPKAYRIIYDSIFDVWCIADALENIHWLMIKDLFDSGYLLNSKTDLTSWIRDAREKDEYDSEYTDFDAYAGYGTDHKLIGGLFFIPDGLDNKKYDESREYRTPTKIDGGTIYAKRECPFNETGLFKELYMKLKRLGALRG